MRSTYRTLRITIFALAALGLLRPAFGQQSVTANSVWNGGTGPWSLSVDWTTNGLSGATIPNNGNMVLCNTDQICSGFFNVTIGAGGNDLVTLDTLPVTIDSLTLGASTGSAALDIGSSAADTLTIGDINAPVVAAAAVAVNSNSTINVFPGSTLNLNIAAANGTVTNDGNINLNSASGTGSSLLINDAGNTHQLTLSGTGTLILQPGSVIQGVSGDEFLQNNSTIQGAGTISNLFIANGGTIDANAGSTLTITPNPNPVGIDGLGAHNGTGLFNGGGGLLEAGSGSTLVLNTTKLTGTEAPIFNVQGVIQVNDGGTLEVIGVANNTTVIGNFGAQINVGGAGAGGTIKLDGSSATFDVADFTFPGTLTLSDNANNGITGVTGTETLINGTGETLSGSGTIENLALVNNGTIIASGGYGLKIDPNAAGFTNNGTLQVNSGSILNLSGSTDSSSSGTLLVNGILEVVAGSTLNASVSTSPTNPSPLTVNGILNVDSASTLAFNLAGGNGTVINNLAINLNAGFAGGSDLLINDAGNAHQLTLSGTGTLTMQAGSAIQGVAGDEFLQNNSTIQGAGTISNLFLSNGVGGTIDANGSSTLTIMPNPNPVIVDGLGAHNGVGFLNSGTTEVSAGATLVFNATNVAGTEIPIDNSGTVNIDGGGTLEIVGPPNHTIGFGNAFGGQINVGSAGAGGTLELDGTYMTVNLSPFSSSTGTLTLSDNFNNSITGVTGTETLINGTGETISGAGTISNLALVNNGTITANDANPLVVTPNASGFTNAGTVNVNSGSSLGLDATAAATAGTNGLTNTGTIGVADGGVLAFADFSNSATTETLVNNGAINVGGSGAGGELALATTGAQNTFQFTGTGSINLSDNPNNAITGDSGTENLVIGTGQTLQGAGKISNLALVNNGTITANSANGNVLFIMPNASGFKNTGTVNVNSGSVLGLDATAAATAGTNGLTNTGTIAVLDGATLAFVTTAGSTAILANNAAINVGGLGAGGDVDLFGAQDTFDITGTGSINLSDNFNNAIEGNSGTENLVIGTGQTLQGAGTISNLALVNNGTITANGMNNNLVITPNASGFTNAGTVNVNSGSILGLDATAAATAGTNGLTNTGTIAVADGATLAFGDFSNSATTETLVNNGAINVGGSGAGGGLALATTGAQNTFQFAGTGSINLSDNPNNAITGDSGTENLVIGTGQTLQGAGTISNLALVNNGTITANGTNALNVTPNAGGFTNTGTVTVNSGSELNVSGSYRQSAGATDVNGTLISAAITITGGTLASGGGIVETKTLSNGVSLTTDSTGVIAVGSGKFTPTPGYQQLANGTLDELISGASNFGTISVLGPASLDGTLDVTLENGFIPTVGDTFAFLDFTPGDLSGTFASFLDQMFDNGAEKWGLDYNNAGGDLTLTAEANTATTTPEPANLLLVGTGLLGLGLLLRRRRGLAK